MKILDGRKQSLYFDFTKIKRSKTIIFNNIKADNSSYNIKFLI